MMRLQQNLINEIMKSLKVLFSIVLCLGIVSCIDGQFNRTVTGNGKVVKKERTASYFDGVRVSTGIDVLLSQGDKESITVEADENLHEYILTEIRDNVLHVYTDNINIRDAEMKRVHVTVKNIKSLKTSSAGDIIGVTALKGEDVEIGASSAGDIDVDLTAGSVEINISSSGNVKIVGGAETMNADLSSAGDLEAYDFKVKKADVNVSSAGDAQINVTETLVARASSAGDINYMGHPKSVDAHSSSAGGVHAR
jgi:hypothetical protein